MKSLTEKNISRARTIKLKLEEYNKIRAFRVYFFDEELYIEALMGNYNFLRSPEMLKNYLEIFDCYLYPLIGISNLDFQSEDLNDESFVIYKAHLNTALAFDLGSIEIEDNYNPSINIRLRLMAGVYFSFSYEDVGLNTIRYYLRTHLCFGAVKKIFD